MAFKPIIEGSKPLISKTKPARSAMCIYASGVDVHKTDGTEKQIWSFSERDGAVPVWLEIIQGETTFEGIDLSDRRLCGYENIIIRGSVIYVGENFGIDFTLCKNVRLENCTIVGTGDVQKGGRNYGILAQGCQNVTIIDCVFAECHIGVSFTQGSGIGGHLQVQDCKEFEAQECWAMVDTHGQSVQNLEVYNCKAKRVILGNPSYSYGGSNHKIHSTSEIDEVLVHGENMSDVNLNGATKRIYVHRPYPLGIDISGTTLIQFQ